MLVSATCYKASITIAVAHPQALALWSDLWFLSTKY